MSEINIFERASRRKLLFSSSRGTLTVDQLWDLKLRDTSRSGGAGGKLDLESVSTLALEEEAKFGASSLVPSATSDVKRDDAALRVAILKRVIEVKLEEAAKAEKRVENAARRTKILEALEAKDNEALTSKSREELLKELAEVGD
jgi:hypothetical protein